MSLSTFEYVNKLLEVSADALGIQYTRQTPTSLQLWAIHNKGKFVANVGMTETRTKINQNLDNVTFATSLFFVVSRDSDLREEDKLKQEAQARKIADDFIFLLKNNKFCTVQNDGFDLIFREGGYLGMGIAGNVSISLPNHNDFCDIFCNTSTKDVECS